MQSRLVRSMSVYEQARATHASLATNIRNIQLGCALAYMFCLLYFWVQGEHEQTLVITQTAAIALEPLTTHPDEWAEPSHK